MNMTNINLLSMRRLIIHAFGVSKKERGGERESMCVYARARVRVFIISVFTNFL